jgi:hypothetical protein
MVVIPIEPPRASFLRERSQRPCAVGGHVIKHLERSQVPDLLQTNARYAVFEHLRKMLEPLPVHLESGLSVHV